MSHEEKTDEWPFMPETQATFQQIILDRVLVELAHNGTGTFE
jgi:hypothetical protein